jgi:hypothetical protein
MAYQLSLDRTDNPALPQTCATDSIFAYPQASSLNQCCRPNTMLYGTAPYMAGKGAPMELIDTSDRLRPQSTTRFGKVLVKTDEHKLFPLNNMECSQPLRSRGFDPVSTRADVQNGMFASRS